MNFITKDTKQQFSGFHTYSIKEASFFHEPWGNSDFSILLGGTYLSLDIDLKRKKALHVSGFSDKKDWIKTSIPAPEAEKGSLYIETTAKLVPGCGTNYDENWKIYNNKEWICIGDPIFNRAYKHIEFANDTIAVIDDGKLVSVWLKPVFI